MTIEVPLYNGSSPIFRFPRGPTTMRRREFFQSAVLLPGVPSPSPPRRQLALHLDYRANVRISDERLTISFDLWRSIVLGIGGEASLGLQGNVIPDETTWRASAWLLKQAAIEAPFDRNIPVVLQMQDFGILIPMKRMAQFFSKGAIQIVLFPKETDVLQNKQSNNYFEKR